MRGTLRVRSAILTGLLALMVAGCAESTHAQSSPVAPTSTGVVGANGATNPHTVETSASPPVSKPLVVTGIPACEAITNSQLVDLGFSPGSGEDHSNSDSADCRWYSGDRRLVAQLVLSDVVGLEHAYAWRDTFNYFEPTELAGYPAVRDTSPAQEGTCEYLIGVGPNRGVGVTFDGPATRPASEYCALAQRLGTMVIGNLQPE